jgi:hypothetical protein
LFDPAKVHPLHVFLQDRALAVLDFRLFHITWDLSTQSPTITLSTPDLIALGEKNSNEIASPLYHGGRMSPGDHAPR